MSKKMKQCKTCSKEIATNAKVCPGCGAENKKSGKAVLCLWAIAFILAVGAVGGSDTDTDNSKEINSEKVESAQEVSQNNSENTIAENKSEDKIEDKVPTEVGVEDKIPTEDKIENKVEDKVPTEYTSALKSGEFYSEVFHMSKVEIYDQLTSEYGDQFSAEAAQYAIDNLEVDWKENALESAKMYQEMFYMSPQEIYDQLIFEMFTAEEAQYAIDNLE